MAWSLLDKEEEEDWQVRKTHRRSATRDLDRWEHDEEVRGDAGEERGDDADDGRDDDGDVAQRGAIGGEGSIGGCGAGGGG
jgi:hypothetical protein